MPVLELKSFDCLDHDPIDKWVPDSSRVSYSLCLHIGPAEEDGADLFYVDVVSVSSPRRGREILVSPYSWSGVISRVEEILEKCEGSSWDEQTKLLSRYFSWEYEDYQPYEK